MSWFTDNVEILKNAAAVEDDNEDKKAAYVYALESASLTQKIILPQLREEYRKLLFESPISVPVPGSDQEIVATDEIKEQILLLLDKGVDALQSFPAYAIAMEIQEDGEDVFSSNGQDDPNKQWKDHTALFVGDVDQLIKLINKAFPIVVDPSLELPQDANSHLKEKLSRNIEVAKHRARGIALAKYYEQKASAAEKAQLLAQLANEQEDNKAIVISKKHESYYQTISEAQRAEADQFISEESTRLIQLCNRDAVNDYLVYCSDNQREAYKAKYQQFVKLLPLRKNLLERAESAKVSAQLLSLIKEYQVLAFKGEVVLAKAKLAEIQACITNNRQKLFCNHYTITVFAKLLQVKARVNAQFGASKYDAQNDPAQPNSLSTIVNNYENNLIHNNDPDLRLRIDQVKRFVINDFQKKDIDQYTPWFLPRFFRWVRSIFTTKSDYENNNSEKQAWSMISADINFNVLPTFVERGITGVQQLTQRNSSISKKLNTVVAPENQQQNKIVKEISSNFAGFKVTVEQMLGANGQEQEKLPAAPIKPAQAAHLAKVVGDERLLTSFVKKQSNMRSYDDHYLTTEETNLLHNVLQSYPKWPDAPLSFDILNNPVESKKYAQQVGLCIREALLHGEESTHSNLLKQFCKFLIPALLQVGDLINIKSGYFRGINNYAGLKFYKEIFNNIFLPELNGNEPVLVLKGNAAELVLWNQIKDLKTGIFDRYDEVNDGFTFSANAQERHTQKTEIAQRAKNLSKAIWSYQPLQLPKSVNIGRNTIDPERFYIKLSEFRSRIREIICETNVGNTPELDVKNKEDIQLLQHFKLQNDEYADDAIDKILNGKLFNTNGNERVERIVQPLVRLLAALNALSNKFLQYPSIGYSYDRFFNDFSISYIGQFEDIAKFISNNNAVKNCDMPQGKPSPMTDLQNLMYTHMGRQVAPPINSPAINSPVSPQIGLPPSSPAPIPPSPAAGAQIRKESGAGSSSGKSSPHGSSVILPAIPRGPSN